MGKESAARKVLKDLRSVVEFAEAVEGLGKLETAVSEAERRRREALDELDGLKREAHKEQKKAEDAKAAAKAAEGERGQIIAEARKEATGIIADAKRRGEEKVAAAQAEADRIRESFDAARQSHEDWKAKARVERDELQGRLDALNKQIKRIREKVA